MNAYTYVCIQHCHRKMSKVRRVRGHAPLGNFGFSYALKCDCLHFEGGFTTKHYDQNQHNFSQSSTFFDNI